MNKFLKICDYIISFIFTICFILFSLFFAIIPIASNNSYYMIQFEKNGVGDNLHYSLDQLRIITNAITSYMFHCAKSMQVSFDNKEVFSPQAISHMADVKVLFVGGMILGYICLFICIISLIYIFYRRKQIKKIFKIIVYVIFSLFVAFIIACGIYVLIDFDSAFILFHKIIFPDPVKFNNAFFPNDDTLINILTIDFFFDIFIQVIVRLIAIYFMFFFLLEALSGKIFRKIKTNFKNKIL